MKKKLEILLKGNVEVLEKDEMKRISGGQSYNCTCYNDNGSKRVIKLTRIVDDGKDGIKAATLACADLCPDNYVLKGC